MARSNQKLDRFEPFLAAASRGNPWQPDGSYEPDIGLLTQLLSVAVGTDQRSGIVAAAADMWAAEELRRAGFEEDEVWPRRTQPRVLPRDVRNFVEGGALPKKLRQQVEERYAHAKARKALPAEAQVLGSAYSKQADVVIASWAAGVEVLVSTKTMLSSYQNNLRNRFEEGYGDAKNIRGRHPLAALGFLYIVGSDIPPDSLDFSVDMLRKLVSEPDVYDCACLLVIEGAEVTEEEEEEARGPAEEPAALVPMPEDGGAGEVDDVDATADEPLSPAGKGSVALRLGEVPQALAPGVFFRELISKALDRVPVAMYPEVRRRKAQARGQ